MSTLPSEVEDLRIRTRDFIRSTVIPAEPLPGERLGEDSLDRLRAAAKSAGVFAPHAPKEYGGQGLALRFWSPIFQDAGYSLIGPTVLNCQAPDEGNMHMLELIGTEDQKKQYLRPLVSGAARSCFGMTEPHPGAGSDPAALQTSAAKVHGGWIINGHKRFTSGANNAAFCIAMVRTPALDASAPEGGAPAGATMLLVDMDTPGVRIGEQISTMDRAIGGGHPHLHFEDVFVPDSAVLGTPGRGFRYAQVRLGPARLTHCMRWLGLARRAMDIALDRTNTREMFGSALHELGIAQDMLALNVMDLETSDAIITKTATLLESNAKAGSALSSVAKAHTSEAVYRVIDRSLQLCGGDGVSDRLPLASYLNEVRAFRIYDGSNETHKWAIARRASAERRRAVEDGAPFQADVAQTYSSAEA
ncbi:acyl-CoA dehydrogenase family protein [Arthrobacter sp. zg-Y820]|uniref:acyl-CoA dehydrogenase family protein n=1 Tax=unclassified Arthrobacter TaxID=235627 RepID=UPI001E5698EC|nr:MULTISPECIES: acyl-CoA dehydrogenase family protein [unclassified Arthrobacter]MCC9197070.1 acyl-CoA dehydrogenase family protein [Arthrobacter sp. zg-Y820]MDK1279935.1 acyl-CoA dehydrogenase family protein [Arthrobacter sp. zg.Y820]WIB09234.1 acyl-CoA dehydrogenase family protein [Arthrobacter sp. zg-Y820]